jgi:hypothetical protein
MVHIGRRHGKLGSRKKGRRTGRKQAGFVNHGTLLKISDSLTGPAGEADAHSPKPDRFFSVQKLFSLPTAIRQSHNTQFCGLCGIYFYKNISIVLFWLSSRPAPQEVVWHQQADATCHESDNPARIFPVCVRRSYELWVI